MKPTTDLLEFSSHSVKNELNSGGINSGELKPSVTLTGVAFSSAHVSKPAKSVDHLAGTFSDNQQNKALIQSSAAASNSTQIPVLQTVSTISSAIPVTTKPTHGYVDKDSSNLVSCCTNTANSAGIPQLPVVAAAPKKSRFTVKTIHVVEVRIMYDLTALKNQLLLLERKMLYARYLYQMWTG